MFILRHIYSKRYYKQQEQQEYQEQQEQQEQSISSPLYDPLIHPDPNKLTEELALCRRQLAIREAEEKQYITCISQLKKERDILLQQIVYLRAECKKGWFHRFFNN
jgi:hypothetical protein